jgi:hypothetical protein
MIDELVKQIASLQKQVDGLIKPEVPILSSWTATVTQNVAVGITSQTSYYVVMDSICWVHTYIEVSGAGTAGNAIIIGGQPAVIQPGTFQSIIGEGRINDITVTDYLGLVFVITATQWALRRDVDAGGGAFVGVTPNFALAAGDIIEYNCLFRRA